ncbi:TonB-dependent receptor [Pedomonas mirosovicensis]|uniref:TonB-dependent receptor n=1 Tax=Pedomonas mirosovicensis TaxID=2908641 RepID=UPI00216A3FEC|nr:TonB-dependent receptor [Pedomonas mirosovicensis]MCH8686233.1 TonB-dependent receptor [Pedomonas mirosovicensis]
MKFVQSNMRVALLTAVSVTAMSMSAAAQTTEAENTAAQGAAPLDEIVVTGIRASIERSLDIKRNAATVVDAISAEDIGKLPDVTISDSLQRIPGVQVRRDAGEGGAINIRGLPQVTTLLNGEAYLGANSVTTTQPNFNDIPSQLFSGADVFKSATADLLGGGITGTVNLRTRRPFDMKDGLTLAAAAEAAYGDKSENWNPQTNALVAYRGERWGILVSGAYSKADLYNGYNGIQEGYNGTLRNEALHDDNNPGGNVDLGGGFRYNNTTRGTPVAGGFDVNGDGDANDAFFTNQAFTGWERITTRKRTGLNASAQFELNDALTLTGDAFYTKQVQYDRTAGFQFQAVNWHGAEYVPGATRDTGSKVMMGDREFDFNTTQVYNYDLPNFDSYSENYRTESQSQNYNLELKFDNGGSLKASLRGIYGKAKQKQDQSYLQFSLTDGTQWHGGVGRYPEGDIPFNTGGYTVGTLPAQVDFTGNTPQFTLPGHLQASLGDIGDYALKTMASENNYRRESDMKVVRGDVNYEISDQFNISAGLRYSERDAENFQFDRVAPTYGGCMVKWKAFDVELNNTTGCTAPTGRVDANGNPTYYTAGRTRKADDASFAGMVKQFNTPVKGVGPIYVLDPKAMDNAQAFHDSFYPGNVEMMIPGQSYSVGIKQTSGYVQANIDTDIGIPLRGNFGVQIINTKLNILQNDVGSDGAYGLPAADRGDIVTDRSFTDVLPSVNFAFDVTDNFRVRVAYAKTMTLLNLENWGGGLRLYYGIETDPVTGHDIQRVAGGNSIGNPDLEPWRADNFDLSFEYYIGRASMVNVGFFYIDVASFIENGTMEVTGLPDLDGVDRNRTITINTPIQGKGGTLKGMEIGWKQSFQDLSFMPLWLENFGFEANLTYSPSDSGRVDLAGNKVPFQDNSEIQTNFAVYYEDDRFQARVAHNFRSKRAVSADFGGVAGLQVYQRPTNYIDASISYDLTDYLTVYAQGSNLTGEKEHYYLTFKDQKGWNNIYERRFVLGARAKF